MKQKLIEAIHKMEYEKTSLDDDVQALTAQKDYLSALQDNISNKLEKIIKDNEQKLNKIQFAYGNEKNARQICENNIYKQKKQKDSLLEEYKNRTQKFWVKELNVNLDNQKYQQDLELEEQDLIAKKQILKKLEEDISQMMQNYEKETVYVTLLAKNDELKQEHEKQISEQQLIEYKIKELDILVKKGQEELELSKLLSKKQKEELDKYTEIYEEIVRRN